MKIYDKTYIMNEKRVMYTAEYYEKEDGSRPAEEFILGLDTKMKAKVLWTVTLLEEYGSALGWPYSRYLEESIYELRIRQSSDISRVLYFFYKDKRIILTNGFVKKTQKTPRNELKLAKDCKKRFLEREGKWQNR